MFVYVPNTSEVNPLETLRRVGLYELHDDGLGCMGAAVNAHGPDGGGGALIGWPGRGETLAMNLERQEWRECNPRGEFPKGRAWIGWNRDLPPCPLTLRRKKQVGGELLRLADGREWLIPIASQAPRRMGRDSTGHVSAIMLPQYEAFFQSAWEALNLFVDKGGQVFVPYEQGFEAAVRILAMNYRITEELATELSLIDDIHLWEIPKRACEAPAVADFTQKKRVQDGDCITSGEPA